MNDSHQVRNVEFLTSTRSMNNKLIVEAYKKEGLKATEKNGFAMITQKMSLKGLRVLVDAKLSDGTFVPRDSTAYIKEEYLHTAAWAKNPLQCDTLRDQFLIVDVAHVEFIAPPGMPAA